MRKIWIILCCLMLSCSAKAQDLLYDSLQKQVPVAIDGYLINLYGEKGIWIFQPCKDKRKSLFDALDNQSFLVQDMKHDLGYTCLQDIYELAIIMHIPYGEAGSNELRYDIRYLYGKVTVNAADVLLKTNLCDYFLFFNGIKKGLSCMFFENYVIELEPYDSEIRKGYLQLFNDMNLPLPDWANTPQK